MKGKPKHLEKMLIAALAILVTLVGLAMISAFVEGPPESCDPESCSHAPAVEAPAETDFWRVLPGLEPIDIDAPKLRDWLDAPRPARLAFMRTLAGTAGVAPPEVIVEELEFRGHSYLMFDRRTGSLLHNPDCPREAGDE